MNVIVALWPALTALTLLVIASVGTTVSTAIVTVLFASVPSAFWFPAASANFPLATPTRAVSVLLTVGVNTAV